MDFHDGIRWFKPVRRYFDSCSLSYRKIVILLFFALAFLLYFGPDLFRRLSTTKLILKDPIGRCLSDRLSTFNDAAVCFDAYIRHYPPNEDEENSFVPYVGNGKIGIVIESSGSLYLKNGRALSLVVPYHPIITLNLRDTRPTETTVVDYTSGIVHRFHCLESRKGVIDVHYLNYAHRTMPALFVQEIKVTNPTDDDIYFEVNMPGIVDFNRLKYEKINIEDDNNRLNNFPLITGQLPIPDNPDQFLAFALVTSQLQRTLAVRRQSMESMIVLVSVHYMGPVTSTEYNDAVEEAIRQAKSNFSRAFKMNSKILKEDHKKVWQQLWSSGFGISHSKAANALNGDRINATIYYVLSHTRSPLHDIDVSQPRRNELLALLSKPDRCYDGHHTLQASTLWSHLSTAEDVINIVSLWKLTLDKQGCHTLMHAGADGAMQAMLLSLGALKFSKNHLEFCSHPRDLHRDYNFRRISYGNATHVNISVVLGEDNKAILRVALDRSDRYYYACDGGCLDPPVQLGTIPTRFPVKLTDPPTAILYVTSDRQHIEELKHTIHVKEVVEAPAHEHHIIALHRHGHHLGGLPAMFWISIASLVLVFHIFLFKLIYNEYCTGSATGHHHNHHQYEKMRARYAL